MYRNPPGYCLLLILFGLFLSLPAVSQSVNASLNEDYYHWIDRYEIVSEVAPQFVVTEKEYIARIPVIKED